MRHDMVLLAVLCASLFGTIDDPVSGHTNPFHPAVNVVKGLPADFYFPGWEIIWNVKVVPRSQSSGFRRGSNPLSRISRGT
ncbi:MAG: hypothetical protein HPY51_06025 [Candidatus Omnitrophica bacterium]|nr:hypothetical protein [Candidatus Omnitrophota bacterium]